MESAVLSLFLVTFIALMFVRLNIILVCVRACAHRTNELSLVYTRLLAHNRRSTASLLRMHNDKELLSVASNAAAGHAEVCLCNIVTGAVRVLIQPHTLAAELLWCFDYALGMLAMISEAGTLSVLDIDSGQIDIILHDVRISDVGSAHEVCYCN